MRNIMTIDVEEFFHAENVRKAYPEMTWDQIPRRSGLLVDRMLTALRERGVRATFFVLGWLAEREPGLVRRIAHEGHEIGCHGYGHRMIGQMTRQEFRDDVRRAAGLLAEIVGRAPTCFRAATFSVNADTLWALDVLREEGFDADSSIYPVRRHRYGMPGAPRHPFVHPSGLREYPMSVVEFCGRAVPISGGGFFRFWPMSFTAWAIRKTNSEGRPYVFYIHPWETDTSEPRTGGLSALEWFQHYCNRRGALGRFERLLRTFSWCSLQEWEASHAENAER
jgi:polysaccharide deacetylase family protein (PEP-CTERM system associated)